MKKIIFGLLMAIFGSLTSYSAVVSPSYPGGEEALDAYIAANLQYPPQAKANGIEGVVGVIFTVNPDGSIGAIKIKRMVDPDLESESIRLVKNMPRWNPATDNGTPVEGQAEVDVSFTLE